MVLNWKYQSLVLLIFIQAIPYTFADDCVDEHNTPLERLLSIPSGLADEIEFQNRLHGKNLIYIRETVSPDHLQNNTDVTLKIDGGSGKPEVSSSTGQRLLNARIRNRAGESRKTQDFVVSNLKPNSSWVSVGSDPSKPLRLVYEGSWNTMSNAINDPQIAEILHRVKAQAKIDDDSEVTVVYENQAWVNPKLGITENLETLTSQEALKLRIEARPKEGSVRLGAEVGYDLKSSEQRKEIESHKGRSRNALVWIIYDFKEVPFWD